jgi:chromosome segregation ATPase
MAIQVNTQRVEAQNLGRTDIQSTSSQLSNVGSTATSPILGGDAVKVTSGAMTDLEKLVARLKTESEETRQSVAQRRIAILLTVLGAMADRVTETQKNNFVKIEALSGEIDDLEKLIDGLNKELSAAKLRSVEMQAKIEALDKAVERAVEEGKEHNKKVEELKEQKERDDAKIRDIVNAIASAKAKIAGLKNQIAECADAIGAATMSEVAAAVKAAAGNVPAPEETESQADAEKKERKAEANNPVNVIRDALDRLDADIRKTIEENQVVKA